MSDTCICERCGKPGAAPEGTHPDCDGLCYACFIELEEEDAAIEEEKRAEQEAQIPPVACGYLDDESKWWWPDNERIHHVSE